MSPQQAAHAGPAPRMKNATKHATALKALVTKLTKTDKVDRPSLDPLAAMVLGTLREGANEKSATNAMAMLEDEFVDLNELRVGTTLELEDMLEPLYDDAGERAAALSHALAAVFDHEGRLSLDRIANLSKREQRPALRTVAEAAGGAISPYVEAHVALVSFGIGVVPLDTPTLDYLKEAKALDADADLAESQKFVEQNVKLDDAYAFLLALRDAAGGESGKKPKAAKKAPAKKAKKPAKSK